MGDDIWRRDEVESPCIKVCSIHPAERICVGCYRTIQEIGTWNLMSAEERRDVLAELPGRAGKVSRRRGGRRARAGGGLRAPQDTGGAGGDEGAGGTDDGAGGADNGAGARGLPPKL